MARNQPNAQQARTSEQPRRSTRNGGHEAGHIELTIRVKDDGGPLYHALAGIPNPHARGDRVRQLLYLGVLVESGAFRGIPMGGLASPQQSAQPLPAPVVPPVAAPEPVVSERYDADDLAAVFGS